jgi:hypothetical protein
LSLQLRLDLNPWSQLSFKYGIQRKNFLARQFAEKRDAFVGFLKAQSDVRALYTLET